MMPSRIWKRIAFKNLLILESTGLTFVGVDGEIARTAVGRRHESPFESGRETGAAASTQTPPLAPAQRLLWAPSRRPLPPPASHRPRGTTRRSAADAVGRQQIAVNAVGNRRNWRSWRTSRRSRLRATSRNDRKYSVGDQFEIRIAVDLDDRRSTARAQAFDLGDCEASVGCSGARFDSELLFQSRAPGRARRAGSMEVGTDLQDGLGLAANCTTSKTRRLRQLRPRACRNARPLPHRLRGRARRRRPAPVQRIEQRTARIGEVRNLRRGFSRESQPTEPLIHRSHSPPIMLIMSKVGTTSASCLPIIILESGDIFEKLGARQRHFQGLPVPSLTM